MKYKLNRVKVYNSGAFSTFTVVCEVEASGLQCLREACSEGAAVPSLTSLHSRVR